MKPLVVMLLLTVGFFGAGGNTARAQGLPVSADDAVRMALEHNLQLKSSGLSIDQAQTMERTAFDPEKTAVVFSQDPSSGGGNDNSVNVSQRFAWPGLYKNQNKLLSQQTALSQKSADYTRAEIVRDTKLAYYGYVFSLNLHKLMVQQDSIYLRFIEKAKLRYDVGESSKLELITAENKYQELKAMKRAVEADMASRMLGLRQLVNVEEDFYPKENVLPVLALPAEPGEPGSLLTGVYAQQVEVARVRIGVERAKSMPDFTIGYGQQLVIRSFDPARINRDYTPGTRIAGLQFGVGIPLFNKAGRARVNQEKIAVQIAETDYSRLKGQFRLKYDQEMGNYLKHKSMVDYYVAIGLKQADEQIRIAQVSYDLGEIGYIEFIQNMSLALQGKISYLEEVQQFNESVIQLQFLKGN